MSVDHWVKRVKYSVHRWIIAWITWSNLILRSDGVIFKHSRHATIQLQKPSMLYFSCLINPAISIVVLQNLITWLKVGSMTSAHTSYPGWIRSTGLTEKQANGSYWWPIRTERGKFGVSTWSWDSRQRCTVLARLGKLGLWVEVEVLSVPSKGIF